MRNSSKARYFVGRLGDHSYRPSPDVQVEIQRIDANGDVDVCAYVNTESNRVTHVARFTAEGPRPLPLNSLEIPRAVIDVACSRPVGEGEYVDEQGQVVPFF